MTYAHRRLLTVDVFTHRPLMGNPVAVVLDAEGLDDAAMQRIAAWTNLSETTFVLPPTAPGAHYHLRIFTPRAELPFAGHPKLGSAHAVLQAGVAEPSEQMLVQQCGVGLVEISVPQNWQDRGLSFRLPGATIDAAPEPDALLAALPLASSVVGEAAVVNVGPRWVIVEAAEAEEVLALQPDLAALAKYDRQHRTTGLTLFARNPSAAGEGDIVVRTFAPADGVPEDPVCGSGNGAVAAYRQAQGQTRMGDIYHASQGTAMGRDGVVDVRYGADGIHIGGRCVTVVEGVVIV